ncbi:hypothetical protein QR680_008914 [Steinernema hermaphroditum]|uniref:Cyclin-like domain-containing protein n=1 Tax=Steinernema hermaphroditum TaxID=289476 RepID=A0AA39IKT5_9BILA|nr:hypothetical protein QR680_008914 [Steinernema hermaphroditum]
MRTSSLAPSAVTLRHCRNDVCSPPSTSAEGEIIMNDLADLPSLDCEAKAPRASRKRRTSDSADARDPKAMKLGEENVGYISPPDYNSPEFDDGNSNHSTSSEEYEVENRDPNADNEGDGCDELNPAFARFPKLLSQPAQGTRPIPPQLNSNDLGTEDEVWSLMCRKDEMYTRSGNYFSLHPDLNNSMRFLLLDWVMELCEQERLHRETFYLVVEYIDRFLSVMKEVPVKQLQLAGATAILIATKLEEIYPPNIQKIARYTDGACSTADMRTYEMLMVQKLEWSLVPITSIHWLSIYFQLLGTASSLRDDGPLVLDVQRKKTPLTPPFARVPLAPNNGANQCTLPRLSASRVGFSCSVEHHKNSCSVPNFMRDEFARVAKILDVCILDLRSTSFAKQSILPAALLFCIYEPDSLISSVTGYTRAQLQEAIDFVEPIVQACLEFPGVYRDPKSEFPEIAVHDLHNIQVYDQDAKTKLDRSLELDRERQKKLTKPIRRRRPGQVKN